MRGLGGTAGKHFYPRPHMEGDGRRALLLLPGGGFLPTPSHGGRRDHLHAAAHQVNISTHALTWRATLPLQRLTDIINISTHALTWRATLFQSVEVVALAEFLPTPSHGGRRVSVYFTIVGVWISTHALTWRATTTYPGDNDSFKISTHALTWRATRCTQASPATCPHFYPRPHMEGDAVAGSAKSQRRHFYPRPHMEGDSQQYTQCNNYFDFYPRPHMEGDESGCQIKMSKCLFLPTPSHGGRRVSGKISQ